MQTKVKPDYIFEVSWEVCNKVGGIHTVIATKLKSIQPEYGDKYMFIGPELNKDTQGNTEFIEDKNLMADWKDQMAMEGVIIRIGRWKIEGSPIAILIDFTALFPKKNEILAELWERYQLDSLSGQWDYVEPALFGYAAGKVIESYYSYFLNFGSRVAAHFHEWMTGAGVLYLESNAPQIARAFTTHATVLGRSIAGNGLNLYDDMEAYNPEVVSTEFNLRSKYSLEKKAAEHAHVFTTVSDVTSRECEVFIGKKPDIITPNGFDDTLVPKGKSYHTIREKARKKMISVAAALSGKDLKDDTFITITSGRYEYRNKGLDIYLETLKTLKPQIEQGKNVLAFITVPTAHFGPDVNLVKRLEGKTTEITDARLTHNLIDYDQDPIIEFCNQHGLNNLGGSGLTVVFVPAYLRGDDGVFNMDYYDLLMGCDLSIFPSYYEPWGYTPLESLAFAIPTVTTDLAGFGKWVQKESKPSANGITVLERNDENSDEVEAQLMDLILKMSHASATDKDKSSKEAKKISKTAQWENLVKYYFEAYEFAFAKVSTSSDEMSPVIKTILKKTNNLTIQQKPDWKKVLIKPVLPKEIKGLDVLAKNMWWTWNIDARELFCSIDPELWNQMEQNPISLLEEISSDRLQKLVKDPQFMVAYHSVIDKFNTYMAEPTQNKEDLTAYFSMEFGIDDTLKIFSGGLGILAGDYLKQASDSNVSMVGIGLLYRYGYFKQQISGFGVQIDKYYPQKFSHLPIRPVRDANGDWQKVSISLPGRNMTAKIWRVDVGRIPLYLMDTDIEENQHQDREVTHKLYGGDWENRLKQELLLGVGGIRLLNTIGVKPSIFHANEGHAAFNSIERLNNLMNVYKLNFDDAVEVVRSTTLFTTHTPVPAGHDSFDEELMRRYIPHYPHRLHISWERFMNLGRWVENQGNQKFSMSVLAAKLSQEMNGVSQIHGKVSQDMFKGLYPGYYPDELHINYVTNGVHYPTWAAKEWQDFHYEIFGKDFLSKQDDFDVWKKIFDVPDKKIWELHNIQKKRLFDYLKKRLTSEMTSRQEDPAHIFNVLQSMDEKALTIGFARRFATYKRAHLLFSNIDRLKRLLAKVDRPVQFIFAGKAHPHDKAGQDLIKRIVEISRMPDFVGKVMFIENYDIHLAKHLISGVDVWLNTPTRPLEASGTSGEKAIMNGVMNFSVLDGWWAEGYKPGAGWAIDEQRTYENQGLQDMLDAEVIYNTLENDITNSYYTIDESGVSESWVKHIKNTFAQIAPNFTMKRMLDDYYRKFYNSLFVRAGKVRANDYEYAGKVTAWKRDILAQWNNIKVVSETLPQTNQENSLNTNDTFEAKIELDLNGLAPEEIGVEILFAKKYDNEVKSIVHKQELTVTSSGDLHIYECNIPIYRAGVHDYVFRIYPKSDLIVHPNSFPLIKWI
ncbi:alpha-glucan family phosphorylase [Lentimicrobium sp. S6]|uniref:alpha-glucan family phosphorylase n=1 Tax=Lentimicrobium sp. S6 TaxID=2735872 RepID=UPI00155807E6|nr:alpha-glucan family phosphorylase [Lentimicrobium sp. S6]NPD45969.1 alpha-glucan family phosphorylase [Lentimicrobium sp. S6]